MKFELTKLDNNVVKELIELSKKRQDEDCS